ncbi:archease [Candidatus Bathyarchaeota archaeon]|nr:archease [Candidatus Bathyarchaeota archaeon]
MDDKKGFEFLEHTADAYVAAYGRNLAEAFENAAYAMFEVMTDARNVIPSFEDHVEVEAPDDYALLYNWLEALLVKFDVEGMMFSKFKVNVDKTAKGSSLRARIWGERFDSTRHMQKVGVKAVTYHRMEITIKPEHVTLKFILDI